MIYVMQFNTDLNFCISISFTFCSYRNCSFYLIFFICFFMNFHSISINANISIVTVNYSKAFLVSSPLFSSQVAIFLVSIVYSFSCFFIYLFFDILLFPESVIFQMPSAIFMFLFLFFYLIFNSFFFIASDRTGCTWNQRSRGLFPPLSHRGTLEYSTIFSPFFLFTTFLCCYLCPWFLFLNFRILLISLTLFLLFSLHFAYSFVVNYDINYISVSGLKHWTETS